MLPELIPGNCLLNFTTILLLKEWVGFTPLIRAATNDNVEIIQLLLSRGASVGARCNSNWTPAHWSASYGKVNALMALVEAGADITKRTSEGWTPLILAQQKRHAPAVAYLESLAQ